MAFALIDGRPWDGPYREVSVLFCLRGLLLSGTGAGSSPPSCILFLFVWLGRSFKTDIAVIRISTNERFDSIVKTQRMNRGMGSALQSYIGLFDLLQVTTYGGQCTTAGEPNKWPEAVKPLRDECKAGVDQAIKDLALRGSLYEMCVRKTLRPFLSPYPLGSAGRDVD